VTEAGSTATFTVLLDSLPTHSVTLGFNNPDFGEVEISSTALTFGTSNWNTSQTLTVTGADDVVVDGDVSFNLTTAPMSSSDEDFDGVAVAGVGVTNLDGMPTNRIVQC
jgi:hypothetical protein